MAVEMCADPVELARSATTAQAEARALADDLVTYRGQMALFEGAFGRKFDNTAADGAFRRYNVDYEAAMVTTERFITVLEEECDALLQTAFACVAADQHAAAGIAGVSPDGGYAPAGGGR